MKLKTEEDILELIKRDKWMISVLKIVKELHLSDWWVGAGFVRNKVWDYLHGYKKRTPLNDLDIIFFDKNKNRLYETRLQNRLKKKYPKINWSIKNQARMHLKNGNEPYSSSLDGLARWTETPTCIGVKLNESDNLVLLAPHGIEDLISLKVRIGPLLKNKKLYKQRIKEKNWNKTWPKLKIFK